MHSPLQAPPSPSIYSAGMSGCTELAHHRGSFARKEPAKLSAMAEALHALSANLKIKPWSASALPHLSSVRSLPVSRRSALLSPRPVTLRRKILCSHETHVSQRLWTGGRFDGLSRKLSVACRAEKESSIVGVDVAETSNPQNGGEGFLPPGWPTVALVLFAVGFVLGPPLDGIHSRVGLQIYDNGAIEILGLKTSIWVPPLLGVFYSVAGLLQLALDRRFAPRDQMPQASLKKTAASLLALALLLELSAEMYVAGIPDNIEAYILFGLAELNWFLLERTWWGFALACFIGVVAPLAEIPLLKLYGLWHYPNANLSIFEQGIVTWVLCCYFFYTPFISNLARWLSSSLGEEPMRKSVK